MTVLLWILAATAVNSLVALVGAFSLFVKEKMFKKCVHVLVAFSAGTLLAGAFFHLLAESLESIEANIAFSILIGAFILFFLIERVLHWHHCHEGKCDVHPVSYLILIGDSLHNFIDGLIIAASFVVNIDFGIITTVLIISHELPQELGDFAILVHGGFDKKKALFFNFLSQVVSVIGGVVGFFLVGITNFSVFILPFAAGGFIYIATSDLIPELHKQSDLKKSVLSVIFFILGIAFMIGIKLIGE